MGEAWQVLIVISAGLITIAAILIRDHRKRERRRCTTCGHYREVHHWHPDHGWWCSWLRTESGPDPFGQWVSWSVREECTCREYRRNDG